ncbi:hypothetical protein Sm713_59720 [Streptomyces sp. TS71-3]|nr:hypothetical protein Sm713_59720 [Streptomyces sp. TS71-3]
MPGSFRKRAWRAEKSALTMTWSIWRDTVGTGGPAADDGTHGGEEDPGEQGSTGPRPALGPPTHSCPHPLASRSDPGCP